MFQKMFHFMKKDEAFKKVIRLAFLLAIASCLLAFFISFFLGCASQVRQTPRMDSTHYVAQAQPQDLQGYPCPGCGHQIPMENISANIRVENKCPNCGKVFFGKPVTESGKARNYQYGSYGPRNYGPTSIYQSDVNYQRFGVGGYSFKETPTGFSEMSWRFHDSRVESYRVIPHWTTTRYHYP